MLSQNSIPTRTRQATELVAGTHELVAELQERLSAGESFDNPKLTEIADKSFGGTRARGRYTSRDAYDALEIAVNKYLDSSCGRIVALVASSTDAIRMQSPRLRPSALALAQLGFETYQLDAEVLDDLLPAEIQPTAILMTWTEGRTRRFLVSMLVYSHPRPTS